MGFENNQKIFEAEKDKKIEKPPVLYHASPEKGIEEFEPRKKHIRSKDEGPVVFGAKDLAFATMFIVREANDSWTLKGAHNGVYYEVINDEERFRAADKGGLLYTLPNDSFECDIKIGMGECEWCSKEPVKPLSEKFYPSGLEAMIENGVQVYFITKEVFEKYKAVRRDGDKQIEILNNLQSENQRLNKNVIKF
jgi:hypothetical protein